MSISSIHIKLRSPVNNGTKNATAYNATKELMATIAKG